MGDPLRVLFLGGARADLVSAELCRGGYELDSLCVHTPEELAAALDGEWDLAIGGAVAGACGSLAALRAIRERGIDLPLIVISGKMEDAEASMALSAGAADHLTHDNLLRLNAAVARTRHAVHLRRERLRLEDRIQQAQKMEAVGHLAADLAHEFNNRLTLITGYSDMLLSEPGWNAPHRAALEEIRHAAEQAGALAYQLLTFSRRTSSVLRTVSLNRLIARMEPMLRQLVGETIELESVACAAPDAVECDPGRLEQVVLNLALNARDAMPHGGRLTFQTGNVNVADVAAAAQLGLPQGRYVSLTTIDTGVGMDEETRRRVFEPFFTGKAPGRGTGLGLAMAHGTVQQLGGTIGVSSQLGQGTVVWIHLPQAKARARTARGRAARKSNRSRKIAQ